MLVRVASSRASCAGDLATRDTGATLLCMPQPVPTERTTTIILCRHGESEGNREQRFGGHSPTPLTEHGRVQARAAAQQLKAAGIDAIYASDLVRAAETAAVIAEITRLSVRSTSALRERSVGQLTGLTFGEARARFPDAFAALLRMEMHACPPDGETYAQCRARASTFLEQVVAEHAGQRVLLVSHQLTVMQLIFHVLGIDEAQAATRLLFQVDHCALHTLERAAHGGWKVVALNERTHLPLG